MLTPSVPHSCGLAHVHVPPAPRYHHPSRLDSRCPERGEAAAPERSHSRCGDQTPTPAQKSRALPGLWLALKLVGPVPCYTGPASQPPAGQGSSGWPDAALPHSSCSAALGSWLRCLVHPHPRGSPVCLGSTSLFLSHHLLGGQVEWVQGARPQLFLAPSAPTLL